VVVVVPVASLAHVEGARGGLVFRRAHRPCKVEAAPLRVGEGAHPEPEEHVNGPHPRIRVDDDTDIPVRVVIQDDVRIDPISHHDHMVRIGPRIVSGFDVIRRVAGERHIEDRNAALAPTLFVDTQDVKRVQQKRAVHGGPVGPVEDGQGRAKRLHEQHGGFAVVFLIVGPDGLLVEVHDQLGAVLERELIADVLEVVRQDGETLADGPGGGGLVAAAGGGHRLTVQLPCKVVQALASPPPRLTFGAMDERLKYIQGLHRTLKTSKFVKQFAEEVAKVADQSALVAEKFLEEERDDSPAEGIMRRERRRIHKIGRQWPDMESLPLALRAELAHLFEKHGLRQAAYQADPGRIRPQVAIPMHMPGRKVAVAAAAPPPPRPEGAGDPSDDNLPSGAMSALSVLWWLLSGSGVVQIVTQGSIFGRFREAVGRRSRFLGELVTCPLCFAVWWGALLTLVGFGSPTGGLLVAPPWLLGWRGSQVLARLICAVLDGAALSLVAYGWTVARGWLSRPAMAPAPPRALPFPTVAEEPLSPVRLPKPPCPFCPAEPAELLAPLLLEDGHQLRQGPTSRRVRQDARGADRQQGRRFRQRAVERFGVVIDHGWIEISGVLLGEWIDHLLEEGLVLFAGHRPHEPVTIRVDGHTVATVAVAHLDHIGLDAENLGDLLCNLLRDHEGAGPAEGERRADAHGVDRRFDDGVFVHDGSLQG
jgi:hypothetical protein